MRNISFSLTEAQFLDGSKTVTRRLKWLHAKAGDRLMACRKCMGLKPGESIVKLGEIEIVSVRRERLDEMSGREFYGAEEALLEDFPNFTGQQFVAMFCKHMKCVPEMEITRLEFRKI